MEQAEKFELFDRSMGIVVLSFNVGQSEWKGRKGRGV